jgi:hypothetical protein
MTIMLSLFLTTTASELAYASKVSYELNKSTESTKFISQKEDCSTYDRIVKPSTNKRSVNLKQFGIKVNIPENYRTLLRSDGEVTILSAVDYDIIACFARGGAGGGRGFYSERVRKITRPVQSSLRSFVIGEYGSKSIVQSLQLDSTSGLLVEHGEGARLYSLFVEIPGIEGIVEIGNNCDCDTQPEDLINFLKNVSLL